MTDFLTSTIQAVLPARLNCRFPQIQQIPSLLENLSYLDKIKSKTESSQTLIQPPTQVLIQIDASTKFSGATCNGISTRKMWSAREMKNHINILESLTIKLAMQTFSKIMKHKAIDLLVDNMVAFMVALTYILKMEETHNLKLVQLSKEIWDHFLQCRITVTAEYLTSKLNMTADSESKNYSDSVEWRLVLQSFQ